MRRRRRPVAPATPRGDRPFAPELAFSTAEDARALLSRPGRAASFVYALGWPGGGSFCVGKGSITAGVAPRLFQHEAEARLTARRTHKLNVVRKVARAAARSATRSAASPTARRRTPWSGT